MSKLKDIAYYFDGGSWHIRLRNGREFVVDNGFGELVGGKFDETGKCIGGEFVNETKKHLYANGHPHNVGSRIANQGEVNKVLSVMLNATGLKIKVEGVITKSKYELIDKLCNFLNRKYHRRNYRED